MTKVFIDGSAGTTGLRIRDRLAQRDDIELISIDENLRKDPSAKADIMKQCDIAFLCLPDDAAREAVALANDADAVIIDTSTAHRTEEGWAYGFAELSETHEAKIRSSKRIAVPGCHASGFIALVYPLIEKGILPKSALLTCHSLTGYSGGGKKMIAEYEADGRAVLLDSPRQYGIAQNHKHLKEMKAITGIDSAPMFSPIVASYYSGMEVTVPLFAAQLNPGFTADDIKNTYAQKYCGDIVKYLSNSDENGFLAANTLSGKDSMEIAVFGNAERILLTARYDNLGKGASGAAIECMNIVTGCKKTKGLNI